jgi:hypothetical protein
MTKSKKSVQTTVVQADDPSSLPGKLKLIGGSKSDTWNNVIANQAMQTIWGKNSNEEERKILFSATIAGLIGIGPNDELEGMLAAQLVACHNASMECYRRAMIGQQTFEGRRENLNQANKLSRTYATLLEALNRHRGKGQQKVTVEHVHVHEGGQAIVGNVEGGGMRTKSENLRYGVNYVNTSFDFFHQVAIRLQKTRRLSIGVHSPRPPPSRGGDVPERPVRTAAATAGRPTPWSTTAIASSSGVASAETQISEPSPIDPLGGDGNARISG